ncbi:hypothetical protein GCM10027074_57260 [Streptomyces deserti]
MAVAYGIRQRGGNVRLHTGTGNTNAVRLDESLSFSLRRTAAFLTAHAPST